MGNLMIVTIVTVTAVCHKEEGFSSILMRVEKEVERERERERRRVRKYN